MSKIFYDIVPPKRNKRKIVRKRKSYIFQPDFEIIKTSIVKIVALLVIISLNWTGLSAVIKTFAYLDDTEGTYDNLFAAGNLDFYLDLQNNFISPLCEPGESATSSVILINNGNIFQYIIEANDFAGGLCSYLMLEANLDGGEVEYTGSLIEFNYGPLLFAEPEDWFFTLTLSSNTPESLQGENCQFKFIFNGGQKNLLLGEGFYDIEEIINNITYCHCGETRTMGYWKNHSEVYLPHLPQFLGFPPPPEGAEWFDTTSTVNQVFLDYELSMRNKLRGQLLAMKFNIAHFEIGGYIPEGDTRTLDDIVTEADNLLRDPNAPDLVLEAMKNLLDYLNNLHRIRFCLTRVTGLALPETCEEIIEINIHDESIVNEDVTSANIEATSTNTEEPTNPSDTNPVNTTTTEEATLTEGTTNTEETSLIPEESIVEETPIIEESTTSTSSSSDGVAGQAEGQPTTEETSNSEGTPTPEEQPTLEEQPVSVPENSSYPDGTVSNGSDDSSSDGNIGDGEAVTESSS